MDLSHALGLWKTSFGPVKVARNDKDSPNGLMGVWVYEKQGKEVIGFFSGRASGNVLQFSWQEPSEGQPLTGHGYIVFEPQGTAFSGEWWTDNRDREGDWTGWRMQNLSPENR